MFITIEDETGIANLVVWPSLFEKQRRADPVAGMIGCRGRIQREGDVIHLVAEHLIDLSDLLRSVANRDNRPRLSHGHEPSEQKREPVIRVTTETSDDGRHKVR